MQQEHKPTRQPTTQSFLATAAIGLEGGVAGELKRMGINAKAEQGGARFECSLAQAFQANLWLRTADRVLLILAEKEVHSFEDLFQLVSSIAWEKWLPRDATFPVSGKCVRSQLMSVRDCQAIGKKALCKRLGAHFRMERFPETGATYPIDIAIHRDLARITLDMSGEALNRRGYRTWNGEAPLRETLAAALVDLSPWRIGMPLYDPCCGTGTLLIEAAMKATRRAPGLTRSFACEGFVFMPANEMASLRAEAQAAYDSALFLGTPIDIAGSDIDPEALILCRRHIAQAGFQARAVFQTQAGFQAGDQAGFQSDDRTGFSSDSNDDIQEKIHVCEEDLRQVRLNKPNGVFLTNPPYGERLSDQQNCRTLYRELGALLRRHPGWQMGVIASDPGFERAFGRRADKKRRLYNGRLECEFYIYDKK